MSFINHGMMASQGTIGIDNIKLQPNVMALTGLSASTSNRASPWFMANNASLGPVNSDRKIVVAIAIADTVNSANIGNLILQSTNGNQTVERANMIFATTQATGRVGIAVFNHPGTATGNLVYNSTTSTLAGVSAGCAVSIRNVKAFKVFDESFQYADNGTISVDNPPGGLPLFISMECAVLAEHPTGDEFGTLTGVDRVGSNSLTSTTSVVIAANTNLSNSSVVANVSVVYDWVGTSASKFMWFGSLI